MITFFNRLTKTQQTAVWAAGIAALVVIFAQFVFMPILQGKQRAEKAIVTNAKTMNEMISLGSQYRKIEQESKRIQQTIASIPPGFTLFSYLEKKASEAAIRARVKTINPIKSSSVGIFEETSAEINLEKITLKQLTNFIYLVESPDDLIRIKRMTVSKNKDASEYLNAVIQVVTYVQAQPKK